MNIRTLFTTALRVLLQHKWRSLLTILSIILGISTVIAVLSIGGGASKKIQEKIQSLGSNVLIIHNGNYLKKVIFKQSNQLTLTDLSLLKELDADIALVSPFYTRKQVSTRRNQHEIQATITGSDSELHRIEQHSLLSGRFIHPDDVDAKRTVCVIGYAVAKALFPHTNPLYQEIIINGIPTVVIGILKNRINSNAYEDKNIQIYLPYTVIQKYASIVTPYIDGIMISITKSNRMHSAERIIQKTLRARRKLSPTQPDPFSIWNQASMAQAAEYSANVFGLFLLIVASLSLLIGGIGVMNIMLVSVAERTKEIGLRAALGARPRDIKLQFLIEAIVLCSIGGVLGVAVGVVTPLAVSIWTGWEISLSLSSIILALGMTILTGITFGYYPAVQASHLPIIQALADL